MSILTIVAKKNGFRRAGHEFGSQPKEIDTSTLTEDQIKLLKTDPMLIVVEGKMLVSTDDAQKLASLTDELAQTRADLAAEKQITADLEKAKDAAQASLTQAESEVETLQGQLKAELDTNAMLSKDKAALEAQLKKATAAKPTK